MNSTRSGKEIIMYGFNLGDNRVSVFTESGWHYSNVVK